MNADAPSTLTGTASTVADGPEERPEVSPPATSFAVTAEWLAVMTWLPVVAAVRLT